MFRIVNTIRIVRQTSRKLSNLSECRLVKNVAKQETCSYRQNSETKLWCISGRKEFHTTSVRNVPPAFLLLIKPLGKAVAIIFGKTVKRWWRKLPPERRKAIRLGVSRNRWKFLCAFGLIPSGFLLYYVIHLEVDPITGRRRFIVINEEQMLSIARLELEMQVETHQNNFLPPSHPAFKRVANVCNKLLRSNSDIPQIQSQKWLITVVDEPISNAFVLPTGHIFMFTGLLSQCVNDDTLGVILAHEISHVILKHSAEQISNLSLLDMALMVPIVLVWAILPDAAALLMERLSDYFSKLMFHLPFSRALETEADFFGLQLAAKACFDVREASAFWGKMSLTEDTPVEWLSTHPNSESRRDYLDTFIPQAIKLREECKCPKLPTLDPRSLIPEIPRHPHDITPKIRGLL